MICKALIIINCTMFPINDRDIREINLMKTRCSQKYEGRSPCLTRVFKLGKLDYRAMCGKPTESQSKEIIFEYPQSKPMCDKLF